MQPSFRANQAIQDGDTRAFDRLYDEFAPRVAGYLFRLTGNRAEAENLTQGTFLAAYKGRDGFQGRAGAMPLAWLLGIARRRWCDGIRYPAPEIVSLTGQEEPAHDGMADTIAQAATLETALSRLNPPYREALHLIVVQGLTYREAAEVTGDPVGTIKWRVSEATRLLRRRLAASEESYEL